jgi:hypothetical protein
MKTNIIIASPGACLSAGSRFATYLGSIGASEEAVSTFNGASTDHPFYLEIAKHFGQKLADAPQFSIEVVKALEGWKAFYRKFFDVEVDLSSIRIPEKAEGIDRLIVIAKGIRLNQVWNIHEEREIPRWQWWNGALEKNMQESERGTVKQTYAIWVHDAQEAIDADEALLKELSAVVIAERKIDTENLLERLVHGLKFFDETSKHLDVKGVTLCASSRFADGDVPGVARGCGGDVFVDGCDPRHSFPCLRPRRAVR